MARQSAKEKGQARAAAAALAGPGHNGPPREAVDAFLDRLHIINDRMDEDRATHMSDMGKVYDEMATELDMPKEVVIATFKADRREQKAQKKAAKMDSRARQAYEKLAASYGPESPLGQYAARMAKAAGTTAAANVAEEQAEQSEEAAAESSQASG